MVRAPRRSVKHSHTGEPVGAPSELGAGAGLGAATPVTAVRAAGGPGRAAAPSFSHLTVVTASPSTSTTATAFAGPRVPLAAVGPSGGSGRSRLSSQLASIADAAASLTDSLQRRKDRDVEAPLLTVSSRAFVVGRLESKFPSQVHFFDTRCTFTFHHPLEKKEILMDMKFGDLAAVALKGDTLSFKPVNSLAHFSDNYLPLNRHHVVSIGFGSPADTAAFSRLVLPTMRRRSAGK